MSRLNAWAAVLVVLLALLAWLINGVAQQGLAVAPQAISAVANLAAEIRMLREELSGAPDSSSFEDLESMLAKQARSMDRFSAELAAYQSDLGSMGALVDGVKRSGEANTSLLRDIREETIRTRKVMIDLPIQVLSVAERKYPTAESRERFNGKEAEPYMDTGAWPEPKWAEELETMQ